jgi:hypothetical protein
MMISRRRGRGISTDHRWNVVCGVPNKDGEERSGYKGLLRFRVGMEHRPCGSQLRPSRLKISPLVRSSVGRS